jgi:hypothetical protein
MATGGTELILVRLGLCCALLLVVFTLAARCDPEPSYHDSQETAIVNLLANPQKYHGKRGYIAGILRLEDDGCFLYLNRDMADSKVKTNALTLVLNLSKVKMFVPDAESTVSLRDLDNKCVAMLGTFGESNILHSVTWIQALREDWIGQEKPKQITIPLDVQKSLEAKRVSMLSLLANPDQFVGTEICVEGVEGEYWQWNLGSTVYLMRYLSRHHIQEDGVAVDFEGCNPRFFPAKRADGKSTNQSDFDHKWVRICGRLSKVKHLNGDCYYILKDITTVVEAPLIPAGQESMVSAKAVVGKRSGR